MKGEKYVSVSGIRTRYFEAGSGPVILLIHGGQFGSPHFAHCALDWALNFDELARSFHVVAYDKVGQGRSENPLRAEDYTMSFVVEHALGLIRALDLKAVNVVGHSRGAYPAARLALDRPDLVVSCTVVDSNTLAPGLGGNEVVMADTPEPRLSREAQRWVAERYSYGHQHITEDWLDEVCAVSQLPKYQEAKRAMEVDRLRRERFLPDLAWQKERTLSEMRTAGLRVPFMQVWGYNDPTARMDQALALFDIVASRQPRARLHVLNQAGHFAHREHPAEFHALVRAFLGA